MAWDDPLFLDFINFDALVEHTPSFDNGALEVLGDSCTRNVDPDEAKTVLIEDPIEVSQIFIQNAQNPLVCVSDSDIAYQLGRNRFPSDDFTESVGDLVFPSVSGVTSRPDTLFPPHNSLPSNSQSWDYNPQHSFVSFEHDAGSSFSGIDAACGNITLSCQDSGNNGMPFLSRQFPSSFRSSATIPSPSTGGHFAESPHTLSKLWSHSSTSSPCPPLSDFSSACSPNPHLRTPNSSQSSTRYTKLGPDAPCAARVISSTTRPLKASLPSAPLLSCQFIGCSFSGNRQLDLTDHENTMHKLRCLFGCPRSFTTRRRQGQHHQGQHHEGQHHQGHRESGSATPHYQCGGCRKPTLATRRDNYLRHLQNCEKRIGAPYICRCGHTEPFDKEEHKKHVNDCKGRAGRPRGSR